MKPIIMSTEDVRAVLDGRKTMARLAIKPQPVHNRIFWELGGSGWSSDTVTPVYGHSLYNRMPYKPSDVLYVREKWRTVDYEYCDGKWSAAVERVDGTKDMRVSWYDNSDVGIPYEGPYSTIGWKPSIHMPREAARLFLRVKDVRVERLQNISAEDCEAEGYFETAPVEPRPRSWFSDVWDARNARRGNGWDSNPWVWVYTFERVERPDGWPGGEGTSHV